jgi:hypothetical protein
MRRSKRAVDRPGILRGLVGSLPIASKKVSFVVSCLVCQLPNANMLPLQVFSMKKKRFRVQETMPSG